MTKTICKLSDLPKDKARGFSIKLNGMMIEIILISIDGEVFAYRNSCPHTGVSLDWMPDEFMDISGKLLQCATHGALFRPEDGYCLHGPCAGGSLDAVKIAVIDQEIKLLAE
jgi:nitrite reductase/ring-hydroxylating ferredoxin subunit